MWKFLKISLSLGIVMGFCVSVFAQAELRTDSLPNSQSQDWMNIQQIMSVVGSVNIPQADRASKRTFDEFFQRKNTMNESVQMLEKATSIRQTTGASSKAPHRVAPKAF